MTLINWKKLGQNSSDQNVAATNPCVYRFSSGMRFAHNYS
jgi:hypothetical protein